MNHLSDKLLAIVLTLMLGLAPLQGAFAAYPDQGETTHQGMGMAHSQADMADAGMADQNCPHCQTDRCDKGANCNTGHCAPAVSLLAAPLPVLAAVGRPITRPQSDGDLVDNPPASLYRPPRA